MRRSFAVWDITKPKMGRREQQIVFPEGKPSVKYLDLTRGIEDVDEFKWLKRHPVEVDAIARIDKTVKSNRR